LLLQLDGQQLREGDRHASQQCVLLEAARVRGGSDLGL
jgi:hypothetical protein